MMVEPIQVGVEGGVATLTLNNPPLNLVTLELTAELDRALTRLAEDPAVRVLIVTGKGERAFCAGSDIKEFEEMTAPGAVIEKKLRAENAAYGKLADFPKPTIAAINGAALGGGLELAVCCDLLIAEEGSVLALPEVKLGVFPGSGGTFRVTRRIGFGRAKEMMLLGTPIEPTTALAWGLVNRVVGRGEALAAAQALAATLARGSMSAFRSCKEGIGHAFDMDEAAAIEASLALSDRAFTHPDCKEGLRAFMAKEEPDFGGPRP